MPLHRLEIRPSARREVERLTGDIRQRVLSVIESLSANPRPRSCAKLATSGSDYRIRVGDYRIMYEVDDAARHVLVYRVRHRRESYR